MTQLQSREQQTKRGIQATGAPQAWQPLSMTQLPGSSTRQTLVHLSRAVCLFTNCETWSKPLAVSRTLAPRPHQEHVSGAALILGLQKTRVDQCSTLVRLTLEMERYALCPPLTAPLGVSGAGAPGQAAWPGLSSARGPCFWIPACISRPCPSPRRSDPKYRLFTHVSCCTVFMLWRSLRLCS